MHILLRYVGKGVSPRGISRELGGEPHEGWLMGDFIESRKPDGSTERRRALTGCWRRSANINPKSSASQALSSLFDGLTTDLTKWMKLSQIHRCDLAIVDAPREATIDGLLNQTDLEFLENRGLQVNIYFHQPHTNSDA